MSNKVSSFLSGLKMTVVSGIFLLASLGLLITKNYWGLHISPFLDPAWFTVVISGFPLLYLAVRRIVKLHGMMKISSALLITIAIIASIVVGEIFAAGEIAFIMAIGAILEDKTTARAKKGLNKLINLTPQQGRILIYENGTITENTVSVEEITVGAKLRVFPGEAIPVDGKIIAGDTSIDQAIMTGESLPVDKSIGDNVYCGTMNLYGSIDIEATVVGENSSLQKMIKLVENAEKKQAPMQRIADKWATWLVPAAILIAILTFVVTYFTIGNAENAALIRGVTILVVFCPCALVLATPTSVMAAIGQATKYGVLIKSGEALEKMGRVNCIAFDKTGTLTLGKLAVSNIVPFSDINKSELLIVAASVEGRSEHPLGKAICAYAKKQGLNALEVAAFEMIPGKGVSGIVAGKKYFCGNVKYLSEKNLFLSDSETDVVKQLRNEGKALIIIASETAVMGVVALSDVIRPEAKELVRKLKNMNMEIVLLTGDHLTTATYFAKQVGITNIYAELLPKDKVARVVELEKQGYNVAMIGDGVNDAPAMKTASIGIAMGEVGSDITVDASAIALVGDDVSKIPYLIKLSKSGLNTIRFNIALSMGLNFIAVILSMLGLLNPITGALVHNAGSVLVVLNAALLYDRKFKKKIDLI